MKFLFELFPILLFFGAYTATKNIYIATGTAIVATLGQVIYSLVRHRKVEKMLWINLGLITVLGGATLLFHNSTFIYWKPTALYALFASILLGGWYVKRINVIEKMMGAQLVLPEAIWTRLLWAWALFFAGMAVLNVLVAFHYPSAFWLSFDTFSQCTPQATCDQLREDLWVKFKVFGTIGMTILFVIGQSIYLSRHITETPDGVAEVKSE
ncbi:inner membrane-spanning protein YciB [Chitinilyticum piscinae]|uniref:Inner membrane-spanning protein YciB n=1 Tax=Chitinilyticum piscinae TaxID=2866724 RepID=A0A8J7G2V1_9NEIS|nr:inner membrane-spanning protein YciB [Chitinilyticum piscinae]MBE9610343.1 septation protein IspZ [Chitinilyticum piscinae]